jgi:hypothetical protein
MKGYPMLLPEDAQSKMDSFKQLLHGTPDSITGIKSDTSVWSLKEILGHLIDSAANNHQRFVRLQEGPLENFPGYNQEFWAQTQHYESFNWNSMIQLWYNYNLLLLHIMKNIPDDTLTNSWQFEGKSLTLQWLAQDYFRHLYHHMQQFEERKLTVENP